MGLGCPPQESRAINLAIYRYGHFKFPVFRVTSFVGFGFQYLVRLVSHAYNTYEYFPVALPFSRLVVDILGKKITKTSRSGHKRPWEQNRLGLANI